MIRKLISRVRLAAAIAGAMALVACDTPATHPGATLWGTATANLAPAREGASVPVEAVRVLPRGASGAHDAVEQALIRSLGFRRVTVDDGAALTLRYAWHAVPADADDEGLGVLLGGSVSDSGNNDVGLGLDLGLLTGESSVRVTAFLLELVLEDASGTQVWRGRADGHARAREDERILRTLVPVLLNYLGEPLKPRRFTR